MASILNTKINSYAIENGIEFDETFATPPTQTGTSKENQSPYWSVVGRSPVYESTVGPPSGSGSWKFVVNSANGCRLRNNGGVVLTLSADGDYSIGFWAKATELKPASTLDEAVPFYLLSPTTTTGFGISCSGGSATNPNKIGLRAVGTYILTDVTMNTTDWYYFAITKTNTNLNFYINGQLKQTRTNMQNANSSLQGWGDASSDSNNSTINISNWYYAATSVIGATEIGEIWTVGSTAPATVNYPASPMTVSAEFLEPSLKIDDIFLATPATATALINHPTIITTIGDSTYVTTSFIGSAEFLPNFAVVAQSNKNIVITETLNASVELINNVLIHTDTSVDFSVEEFIASATFVKPFIAEQPFIASATMPGGTATVQANYFNLVKSLNPVFYYNFDTSTIQNFGSWTFDSPFVGSTVAKNQASTGDLGLIGAGKSWKFTGSYNNAPNEIEIPISRNQGYVPETYNPYAPPLGFEPVIDLVRSRSYAIEYWFKPTDTRGIGFSFKNIDIRFDSGLLGFEIDATLPGWSDSVGGVPGPSYERFFYGSPLVLNDWNHVVLNAIPGEGTNDQIIQFWVNGNLYLNRTYSLDYTILSVEDVRSDNSIRPQKIYIFSTSNPVLKSSIIGNLASPQPYNAPFDRGFWNGWESAGNAGALFDEVAIYEGPLTNSQIIDHYSFIYNQSPDRLIAPIPLTAEAESGNHVVLAISNADIVETPATASSLFVNPTVLTVKNLSISTTPLTASALNTDVTVYYGWTIYADPAIAAAEIKEGFALNTTYYDYIQANIVPYRYVTFDTATPFADYGTDTDYAVNPTVVGGIIVNPDIGITGKSAKTAGTSYTTDGVILKESEHDDNWGTGNNSWHSSFWMERAIDDASTTGLRVLWNLNGHNDDQNVILYHYQNKLHLQINNQVGAPITITSANNISLFDYTRHNIVIRSHHNNNNNHLYVYVDAMLVLDQNIGSYAVTTINNPIHVGANSEANNFPRLGVGCLITPFVDTALPVVPANTKLILDEIYWDKNDINQTQVTNIFNVMPDKVNANTVADVLTASAEKVMPAISTTVNFVAAPATASAEFVDPSLFVVRIVNVNADTFTASALMTDAIASVQISVTADVFVVTAIFNEPVVFITFPAQPMLASVELVNRRDPLVEPTVEYGISVTTNGITYKLREFSPYVRYLRIVARNQKIYKDMEIL